MVSKTIQELFDNVYDISCRQITADSSDQSQLRLIQELFAIAEQTAAANITDEEREHMSCSAGCSTCCRVNVPLLHPEALAIKDFLLRTKSGEEITKLKEKMQVLNREICWLEEEERILANKECAFLNENGICDIYPARPLMCRSVTSADASACKEAMTMLALNENIVVPMNIMQKSVMDTTFKGLAKALKDTGQEDRSREMTSALLHIM